MLDEFMHRYADGLAPHTRAEFSGMFERVVKPKLGEIAIHDLKRLKITELLDDVNDKHGGVMGDRCLKYLRRALNWWQTRDDDFVCPVVRGMSRTKPRERARSRVLNDDELRALWPALDDAGTFGDYVRMILLSAQRPGEVGSLRRDEIRGGTWVIPAAKYKGRRSHSVPLTEAALAIIEAQPARQDGYVWSPWVQKSGKLKAQLDKALKERGTPLAPWVLHDLRRTARTLMSRAKVSSHTAERVLGHVIPGVEGVYDHHHYDDEKRDALERLAAEVQRVLNPPPANVVELHARQAS